MTIAQEHSFGFSPPSNSSPSDSEHQGSMLYDDLDSKDGMFDDDKLGLSGRKMTGRKGPGPVAADKRATHNAIERARRESLNGRFMVRSSLLCFRDGCLHSLERWRRRARFETCRPDREGTDSG